MMVVVVFCVFLCKFHGIVANVLRHEIRSDKNLKDDRVCAKNDRIICL